MLFHMSCLIVVMHFELSGSPRHEKIFQFLQYTNCDLIKEHRIIMHIVNNL